MKEPLEEKIPNECIEQYDPPCMEVIEVEAESPLLQMSGEDSPVQDW